MRNRLAFAPNRAQGRLFRGRSPTYEAAFPVRDEKPETDRPRRRIRVAAVLKPNRSRPPPIGSGLIRRRFSSITTTLPSCKGPSSWGSCSKRSLACASGRRSEERRKITIDGSAVLLRARSVPKSVSAKTMTRPSRAARSKISSSVATCISRSLACKASCPAPVSSSATTGESALSPRNRKPRGTPRDQTSGISRSLTASAA